MALKDNKYRFKVDKTCLICTCLFYYAGQVREKQLLRRARYTLIWAHVLVIENPLKFIDTLYKQLSF